MSTETSIIAEIMDLIELKRTLSQLQTQYQAIKSMKTCDGKTHKVEVVIKDPTGRQIGLEKTDKGAYRFIADSEGLTKQEVKQQKTFINKIKQKYAYNKVISELKSQGYNICEEEKVTGNTIRLVARKWS